MCKTLERKNMFLCLIKCFRKDLSIILDSTNRRTLITPDSSRELCWDENI